MIGLGRRWERARGTEDFAWACLLTNVVGVPGLGTLMAQRWEGVPQLTLAIAGGVLMEWLVRMTTKPSSAGAVLVAPAARYIEPCL